MGELLVLLVIALAVVVMWRGPKTLPRLGEALGRGLRKARREAAKAVDGDDPHPEPRPPDSERGT